MNAKGKLFVLWIFVAVIIALVITHFSHGLAFVLENLMALALPAQGGWIFKN
jgi:hypothetical protein